MKKLIVIVLIMLFSTVCFARDNSVFAKQIATLAKITMELRQGGVPLVVAMDNVDKIVDIESLNKLMKSITIEAYKTPKFATKEHQREAVTEFSNKIYIRAMEAGE